MKHVVPFLVHCIPPLLANDVGREEKGEWRDEEGCTARKTMEPHALAQRADCVRVE